MAAPAPSPNPASAGVAANAAAAAVARLADELADHRFKGLPPDAAPRLHRRRAGRRAPLPVHRRFHHPRPRPLRRAPGAQPRRCSPTYSARHGLAFAPHGKTSMAPQLFDRQLRHGAWGITARRPTPGAGGPRLRHPADLPRQRTGRRGGAALARRRAGRRLRTSASSATSTPCAVSRSWTRPCARPAPGVRSRWSSNWAPGDGARTGARTEAECAAVADAVAATGTLRLAGVAGYEAEVPGADLEAVRGWLRRLTGLAVALRQGGTLRRAATRSWSARAAAPGSTRSPKPSPSSPNCRHPV